MTLTLQELITRSADSRTSGWQITTDITMHVHGTDVETGLPHVTFIPAAGGPGCDVEEFLVDGNTLIPA